MSTADTSALVALIDAALPQTQCTRCGYPDCRSYAAAIANDGVPINLCPPGGAAGIGRLAALTGQPVLPLSPEHGQEAPRLLASIVESACIGCALCLKACPVDAIVGAPKRMHTVLVDVCTGCELCVPPCPVDCIVLTPVTGARTGWDAWSDGEAQRARSRYTARLARLRGPQAAPAATPESQATPAAAFSHTNSAAALDAPAPVQAATPATTGPNATTPRESSSKAAAVAAAMQRARERAAAQQAKSGKGDAA